MEAKKTTTKKTNTTRKTTTAKKPAVKKTTTAKTATAKKSTATKAATAKKKTTTKTATTKKTTTTRKTTSSAVKKPAATKITTANKSVTVKEQPTEKVSVEEVVAALTKQEETKKEVPKPSVNEFELNKSEEEKIYELRSTTLEKPKIKKKVKVRPIFKLIFLLIILGVIAYFGFKFFFCKKDSYKDKATYTTSFFIKNNKGKYALYNDSGKKLTGFEFDSVNAFINNSVLVHKEKEGYAIIDNKGKEIVSYGKYNYISNYAGIYKVRTDKGYKLLDSDGKTIVEADAIDVSSYGNDFPFNVVTAKNEVMIISYDGKTITKFKQDKSAKSPTVNHKDEYATVYYNGKNVIFNSKTKKVISEYKKDVHYCINGVTEDGKVLTLNACASWFESLPKVGYMVSVKGNIVDLSKKCNNISVIENTVICSTSTGERFVKVSGKKATLGNEINNRTAFIDEDNYVTRNNKTFKIELYKKGKKVKTMDGSLPAVGKMQNKMYIIYTGKEYEFYDKDGKKAIKESYKYASSFDKNGLARVSKDGITYYLINEKGKKISESYNSISSYEDYYQVSNKNGLKGIIDKKGKEIVSVNNTNINIKEVRDKYYAIVTTKEGKYVLYDLENNKKIKESKVSITINDHYIKVTSDSKTSYYTYKDKLIYEEK